jgi:hypothetical protein
MDESKLTPSEQVMLGIFKAQAGNQLDGEAFIRAKAPFGNWAPSKPSVSQAPLTGGGSGTSEIAVFHYVPQKTIFDRIVKML